MALVACGKCGQQVSNDSSYCPHCGTKKPVRKISGVLNVVLVVIGLCVLGNLGSVLDLMVARHSRKLAESSRSSDSHQPATPARKLGESEAERMRKAPKLLAAAKASDHPGIIMRHACQVPVGSPLLKAAEAQVERAERIWDQVVLKPQRAALARTLQENYFRQGAAVHCSMIEGKHPTLKLTYVLFGETTAWLADDVFDAAVKRNIAAAGIERIYWNDGYGKGSQVSFKSEVVKQEIFGSGRDLCRAVREGRNSPDAINATVPDQM